MKFILLIIGLICLVGCHPSYTIIKYSDDLHALSAKSKPIYLKLQEKNSVNTPFHFILKHDLYAEKDLDHYLLYVRWNSNHSTRLFDGMKSTLKLSINDYEILTLYPIKMPKVIGYNIESVDHYEEAIFSLTFEQLKMLANAREVRVLLIGKSKEISGYFTKYTFRAFKDFFNNG